MDASDRELQQYLFDLQGYLVIHNVLSAAEVAELNRLIDSEAGCPLRQKISIANVIASARRFHAHTQ